MRGDLLYEIGTEEIPAGFLARALVDLKSLAEERLQIARLDFAEVATLGAPRRLTLAVRGLADRQANVSETVTGPPASVAFDKEGKPTKAAVGFAAKNGVAVEALTVVEMAGKGSYVAARREQKGEATRALLPKLLVDLTRAIPWKKSMRWASFDEAFVRPIHWLVAVYAGEVVPLELFGVTSGRESRGHRFLAPGPIALDGTLDDYKQRLRAAFAMVDPDARKTAIEAELRRAENEAGVRVRPDPELLDEVTNLVEYPQAVAGSFDAAHLEIPAEVIISAMRKHQRYFATDKSGKLAATFITIAGTITKDPAQVRQGNERVLAARLADARFFFDDDRAHDLDYFFDKLGGLVFQAKLGTMKQKVERIIGAAQKYPVDSSKFTRVAGLCKADLTTKMVGEFPDLQGVMGRHYALLQNEEPVVAEAILEHYLPRGATDALPEGDLGAAVGIADRMDTIVGCFSVGLQPTGSNDAFGLRRAALAVLNILIARRWHLSLAELAGKNNPAVLEFFKTRLRGLLVEQKDLPADCVDAALAAGFDDVPDAVARATAVVHLPEALAIAFKRVANILKGEKLSGAPDSGRFSHASEKALWDTYGAVRATVDKHIAAKDYDAALRELATLKPAVDKFFDDVLVMDPDEQVKHNRLALLGTINNTFLAIADFRQLAVK